MEARINELKLNLEDINEVFKDRNVTADPELLELLNKEKKEVENELAELINNKSKADELRKEISIWESNIKKAVNINNWDYQEFITSTNIKLCKHRIELSILENKELLKSRIRYYQAKINSVEEQMKEHSGGGESNIDSLAYLIDSKEDYKKSILKIQIFLKTLESTIEGLKSIE